MRTCCGPHTVAGMRRDAVRCEPSVRVDPVRLEETARLAQPRRGYFAQRTVPPEAPVSSSMSMLVLRQARTSRPVAQSTA